MPRHLANAVPNGEPGCALTHAMQARPQSSHDCHHSSAGHSLGSKDNSSGGGPHHRQRRPTMHSHSHQPPWPAALSSASLPSPPSSSWVATLCRQRP
jgi:hypothetical protein